MIKLLGDRLGNRIYALYQSISTGYLSQKENCPFTLGRSASHHLNRCGTTYVLFLPKMFYVIDYEGIIRNSHNLGLCVR